MLVVGSYLSPYVRKALACLEFKGIAYEIDPIVPFYGDDRFSRLSPLRRIPVLIDGDLVLTDSSVICQYLEDLLPSPSLLPGDIRDRARARWLEEFADSRMGDVFIWRLYYRVAVGPAVWGDKRDAEQVARTLAEDVPAVLDYLEAEAPADGFRFGAPTMADIAPACFIRNAHLSRVQIDATRWPRTAGWMARTLALPVFEKLATFENAILRRPIAEHRDALRVVGAPLSAVSYGTPTPRRGVMPI